MQKGFKWITFISHNPVVLVRFYKFGYFTLNFYGLKKKVGLWTISTYYIPDHDYLAKQHSAPIDTCSIQSHSHRG